MPATTIDIVQLCADLKIYDLLVTPWGKACRFGPIATHFIAVGQETKKSPMAGWAGACMQKQDTFTAGPAVIWKQPELLPLLWGEAGIKRA